MRSRTCAASSRGRSGGRLVARFGEPRAGGVKWDGVLVATERGAPVRAVYGGRVIYADWLPGLGLLTIVDHGEGYMSLYGHNERLYKAAGERVNAGRYAGVRRGQRREQPAGAVFRDSQSRQGRGPAALVQGGGTLEGAGPPRLCAVPRLPQDVIKFNFFRPTVTAFR